MGVRLFGSGIAETAGFCLKTIQGIKIAGTIKASMKLTLLTSNVKLGPMIFQQYVVHHRVMPHD